MNTIIIGMGEVGRALRKVLSDYEPQWADSGPARQAHGEYDIMHICFPYSDNFVKYVKEYQEKYKPAYTVIHSSVPVGTSSQCSATHSPIRGLHPHLESGIRTFPKFIGGQQASDVADYFRRAGLKVVLFDKSETTEAMKLFDTLYYGVCIEFAKEVKRYCDGNGLNFSDVYRLANMTYNDGYKELGHPEFVRPVLEPIMKVTGGHCVVENSAMIDTPLAKFVKSENVKS
jgi:UDP-glucose 6-dehydrogenase